MITLLKIISESVRQAFGQLRANKLRSFLSLLGISIGIFCIIGVLSSVDSLESNVRGSLEKLGNDVVYVKKWPWADTSGDWWKYFRRPNPDFRDYEVIRKKVKNAALTAYHVVVGFKTAKWKSNSVERTILIGSSISFAEMFQIEFEKGRYFSPSEAHYGSNKIVLGFKVAQELFGSNEPIGRTIKMSGRKYEVIGVIKEAGNDLLNPLDFDDCLIVSYNNARGLANLKAKNVFDATVTIKAADGVAMQQLKDEAKGILRAHRKLKPKQGDNFSLNELSMISSVFDNIFGVLNLLGIVIGGFAIIVGMVSVANIMFVSVKERTNIIGIKKALGAQNWVVLSEFLIESVILCIIGGLMGLMFVYLIVTILSNVIDFELYLSFSNIAWGLGLSVIVGMFAGLIPAVLASRMDPVEAMRK
ncbi:MAG: ABC transporter permease [Saprospiraceae bacterium]|nr:ABC transporter permease [Saprospiraceae bacterium]